MTTSTKPAFSQRVEDFQISDKERYLELTTTGLKATFYRTHFESLCRHFFDIEKDYLTVLNGGSVRRTNQGHMLKLFQKTLRRIHKARERGRVNYTRWLATASLTWLKTYLQEGEHVETVIDHYFNISDSELTAETTQRSRQVVAWQVFCVKEFLKDVDHPENVEFETTEEVESEPA